VRIVKELVEIWPNEVCDRILEMIEEKEKEIEQENSRVREWTEEDEDKMGNMINPCYEL